jgi:hypothetical protein
VPSGGCGCVSLLSHLFSIVEVADYDGSCDFNFVGDKWTFVDNKTVTYSLCFNGNTPVYIQEVFPNTTVSAAHRLLSKASGRAGVVAPPTPPPAPTAVAADDDDTPPLYAMFTVLQWSDAIPAPANFAVPSYCTCKQ